MIVYTKHKPQRTKDKNFFNGTKQQEKNQIFHSYKSNKLSFYTHEVWRNNFFMHRSLRWWKGNLRTMVYGNGKLLLFSNASSNRNILSSILSSFPFCHTNNFFATFLRAQTSKFKHLFKLNKLIMKSNCIINIIHHKYELDLCTRRVCFNVIDVNIFCQYYLFVVGINLILLPSYRY